METSQEDPPTKLGCPHKPDEPKESSKACPKSATSTGEPAGSTNDSGAALIVYDVEHLATFSTAASVPTSGSHAANQLTGASSNNNHNNDVAGLQQVAGDAQAAPPDAATSPGPTTPRVALRKLFELEKLSGIWTQHMQIELRGDLMLIVDCETNCVVEQFHRHCVSQPEAFNHYNHIYNNIVVFIIEQLGQQQESPTGSHQHDHDHDHYLSSDDAEPPAKSELHIFQCVSHQAQQLVDDIIEWKSAGSGCADRAPVASHLTTGSGSSLVMTSSGSSSGGSSSGAPASSKLPRPTGAPASKQQPEEARVASPASQSSPSSMSDGSPVEAAGASNKSAANATSTATSKPMLSVTSSAQAADTVPIVNVNVKETVQVFNQIAALRGKSTLISPTSQHQQPNTAATPSTSRLSSVDRGSPGSTSKPTEEPGAARHNNASATTTTTTTTTTATTNNNSSPSGPYKRRTIRAILAPGVDANPPTTGRQQQQQPTCSSSSGGSTSSSGQQKAAAATGHPMANGSHPAKHQAPPVPYGSQRDKVGQHSSSRTTLIEGQSGQQQQRGAPKQKLPQQQPLDPSSWHASELQQSQALLEQVTSNESYVSVLNHCFDDIELFIIRLQHAMTALQGLHRHHQPVVDGAAPAPLRKHSSKRSGNGAPSLKPIAGPACDLLSPNEMGPAEDDFYEIFSKFKLAFNLLAKLKGCIHEPNAPELVHFLFTPLSIIVEAAQNAKPPIDPTAVGIPYLNQDALDLLSNCCTSKESDTWNSLGPNWTQTIDVSLLKASRLPSSFQPIFSDGWAPVIGELELIGLVMPGKKKLIPKSDSRARGRPNLYGADQFAPAQFYNMASEICSQQDNQNGRIKLPSGSVPGNGGGGGGGNSSRGQPRSSSKVSQMYSSLHDGPDLRHPASDLREQRRLRDQSPHSQSHSKSNWRQPARHSSRPPVDYPDRQLYYQPEFLVGGLGEHGGHPMNSGVYSEYKGNLPSIRGEPYPDTASIDRHKRSSGRDRSWNRYDRLKMPLSSSYHPNECPIEDQIEATLLELGPAQMEWFYELQDRGAMIVKVLFSREANNDKELSVKRGELLEILDDSRKWWRARNIELQSGHVPHTIVGVLQDFRAPHELISDHSNEHGHRSSVMHDEAHHRYHQRHFKPSEELPLAQTNHQHPSVRDTSSYKGEPSGSRPGAMFRYF